MRKGVVPAGVFCQILESHARQRRQSKQTASAAVAAVRATEQKGQAAGASGTKEWLRMRAAKQMRLERAVGDAPAAELCRSKRLMKCMPELPENQPGVGQVARSSGDATSHSPTRGKPTDADARSVPSGRLR